MGSLKERLETGFDRVAIAHNPVALGDDLATADVLAQAALVADALTALGIPHFRVAVPGGRPWETLPPVGSGGSGLLVFNLVEAPTGAPWLQVGNAAALELLGLPFTGASAAAIQVTTDKLTTRALLAAAGLPVAPGGRLEPERPEVLDRVPPPWILKPAWEDASLGLEGDPIFSDREAALTRAFELIRRFPGQPVLAESFLPGREINVSLLAVPPSATASEGVSVLPVAEIVYVDYADRPRVLGYEAKWETDSFAYLHTVRRFLEAVEDGPLIARATELALAAWHVCGLTGYARVDLRLDEEGKPHILEVNANPCLAADSGFLAAAERAGLSTAEVVHRILAAARWPPGAPLSLAAARSGHRTATSPAADLHLREGLLPADRPTLEALLTATRFFNSEELSVAMELIDDRLREGPACHYRFLVAEVGGKVVGYTCWGPIAGTAAAADLYWIAVSPDFQNRKVGAALLAASEERMAREGRTRIYVETSTRPQYEPTRRFYAAQGYHLAAEIADFYAPGDGKALFVKVLPPPV
ncbi:MAG TPA: GNAT family N-acetyltransferase [Thermoanaerobaculia bacterium]|nr:GNAT family N-acetyltransferase [Thermoanaerobaculia bacterium]